MTYFDFARISCTVFVILCILADILSELIWRFQVISCDRNSHLFGVVLWCFFFGVMKISCSLSFLLRFIDIVVLLLLCTGSL